MEQFQLNWYCHHHFKNGLCATLLFAHVRDVQAPSRSRHIWARFREPAPTLSARGVCWHFTHVLLDTETQLLQASGLVAVSSELLTLHSPELNTLDYCFWGAYKHSVYRNKPDSLEKLRLTVEQCVREVPADTAKRVGVSFLERVQMCLERSGAYTSSTCANKKVAHRPFFK